MSTRPPAVAGQFYEGTPERLRRQVAECLDANPDAPAKEPFIGAVVPHAGLMYSGHVAGAFYKNAALPKRFVILCPNHTGIGHFAAINREGEWRTPLGNAKIDTPLADELMKRAPMLADDWKAHAREHSLEVQLPFLQQQLAGDFTFVPLCLATHNYALCVEIGDAIAEAVRGKEIGIVASSDLNHYEDQQTTLRKDQLAIDEVLELDPRGLWDAIDEHDVSMCGFIPTTVMLVAAKKLGATRARLLKHATSGDINRDYGHVVGYAAITIA